MDSKALGKLLYEYAGICVFRQAHALYFFSLVMLRGVLFTCP